MRSNKLSHICNSTPRRGTMYCDRCRCEAAECVSPKAIFGTGGGRWCCKHSKTLARRSGVPLWQFTGEGWEKHDPRAAPAEHEWYLTGHGWQKHPPSATPLRRFICTFGFVLRWCCPLDLAVGIEAVGRLLPPRSGSADRTPPPDGLTALFIAHCLKWPPAVEEFLRLLPESTRPWTADVFAKAVVATIRFCSGKTWPEMLRGMNVNKRMNAVSGVAVYGGIWGVLRNMDAAESLKSKPSAAGSAASTPNAAGSAAARTKFALAGSLTARSAGSSAASKKAVKNAAGSAAARRPAGSSAASSKAAAAAPAAVQTVRLGPQGTRYSLAEDAASTLTERFDAVLLQAAQLAEPWPAEASDPRPFLAALADFYAKSRSSGSASRTPTYGCQRFTRWTIAYMEQVNPSWFGDLDYRDVQSMLPDEKELVEANFDLSMPLASLRALSDLAFWEVSMWCCLLSDARAEPFVERMVGQHGVSPEVAMAWLRCREIVVQSDDWGTWPMVVPDTLRAWCEAPSPAAASGTPTEAAER